MQGSFNLFTERAREVLVLAEDGARHFNHNYIGTEHLLLGLVAEREGVAAKVLVHLGLDLAKVRNAVEFIIGRGEVQVVGQIGLTPRATRAIELARDEARRLGHRYIGTEHILLGLLREGEGIAAGILESLGVNFDRVRSEVIMIITGAGPTSHESAEPLPIRFSSSPGYEYLVAQTRRAGVEIRVIAIRGHEDVFEPGADGAPLHSVLRELGNDGWELAGIDCLDGQRALYVFKRRTL